MIRCFIILLTSIVFCSLSFAQTPKESEALKLGRQAINFIDDGQYLPAIDLLEKAADLDPKNFLYPYEIAYAHHLNKSPKEAIKVLKKIIRKNKKSDPQVYQLLGNVYDLDGNPDKALKVYQDGLKSFPNSGRLYLEMGVVEAFSKEDYDRAMAHWEEGIKMDPTHASNYYWAGKIYCHTENRLWGIIYGEIFMNLERNTKRTVEMSELLYKTYQEAITIKSNNEVKVNFAKSTIIMPKESEEFKIPFHINHSIVMSLVATPVLLNEKRPQIGMDELVMIRTQFINEWYKQNKHKEFDNLLFDFQKSIENKNYFEPYSRWLLMLGDQDNFDTWYSNNKEHFDQFIQWFAGNGIIMDNDQRFYRSQYE